MKIVEYRFTFITSILEIMSKWFDYPRRPYSVLVAKHPNKEKYVVLALCNRMKNINDNHGDVIDYVLLPLDEARAIAEKIRITADQIETFGG